MPPRSSAKPARLHPHLPKDHSTRKHRRFTRRRLEYCDCGNLAVVVLKIQVGTDPQYTIRMPLCPACLKLEQALRQDLPHDAG